MLTSGNVTVKKKTPSSEPEKELGQDMGGETESKPHKQQWQRPMSLGKILDSTLLSPYLFPWRLSIHWKLGRPFQSDLVDVLEDVARRDEKGALGKQKSHETEPGAHKKSGSSSLAHT
jgi:hypothetical protein